MKFVVFGASGQLAKEFIKEFESKGMEYVGFNHKEADISNLKLIREILKSHKPDVVLNCAAYNEVDRAENDWKTTYLVNGMGPKNLAIACEENKSVLVHYSTDYVFDGEKNIPYTIADKTNPLSNYGKSKLLGESFVESFSNRYYLIRTSWVFGKGNDSNFAKKVLKWSAANKELKIVDDQISNPTYTVDLAKATLDLIKTDSYGLCHITNSDNCSRYEWAKYLLDSIGWNGVLLPAKSDEFKTLAQRPKYSSMDDFPIKNTIGYNLLDWKDATDRFLKEFSY